MPKAKVYELDGQRFGRLTVKWRSMSARTGTPWVCKCDCGKTLDVDQYKLVNGIKQSCGCLKDEMFKYDPAIGFKNRTHGMSASATYQSWADMRYRCYSPKFVGWKNYGGRGITVCLRWASFENFLADMGECPDGHTLDRIDVNGHYEPSNCRWATRSVQARNKRKKGEVKPLAEFPDSDVVLTVGVKKEFSDAAKTVVRHTRRQRY